MQPLKTYPKRLRSPQAQPDGVTVVAEDSDGPAEVVEDQPAEVEDQPAEDVDAAEPESRTILETTVERAEYMPLFVAPQPVKFEAAVECGRGFRRRL